MFENNTEASYLLYQRVNLALCLCASVVQCWLN